MIYYFDNGDFEVMDSNDLNYDLDEISINKILEMMKQELIYEIFESILNEYLNNYSLIEYNLNEDHFYYEDHINVILTSNDVSSYNELLIVEMFKEIVNYNINELSEELEIIEQTEIFNTTKCWGETERKRYIEVSKLISKRKQMLIDMYGKNF